MRDLILKATRVLQLCGNVWMGPAVGFHAVSWNDDSKQPLLTVSQQGQSPLDLFSGQGGI